MTSYRVGNLHVLTGSELKALLVLVPMNVHRVLWVETCMEHFGWSREAADKFTAALKEKASAMVV